MALIESEYIPSSLEYEIALGVSTLNYNDPNLVLLDTCAQVSIFRNANLLTNIEPVDDEVTIFGLSTTSPAIKPSQKGTLPGFEGVTIYISNETKRNILCFVEVSEKYHISLAGDQFCVESSLGPISFHSSSNVIAQAFQPPVEVSSVSAPTGFTKQQFSQAELARTICKRLAFESYQSLILAIRHGSISNLPITIRDVHNAVKIFGPCVPSLKGKAVAHKIAIHDAIEIEKLEEKQQSLEIDIFLEISANCLETI